MSSGTTSVRGAVIAFYALNSLLAGLLFLLDLHLPPGLAAAVPYIAVVLISFWLPGRRSSVAFAVLCSILTLVRLALAFPAGLLPQMVLGRGFALFAIWVTWALVAHRKRAERRRRATERALAEAVARSRAFLNAAADGIITIDESGRIDSVNPAVCEMFGYTDQELIGENVNRLMPFPHREEHDRHLESYLHRGHSQVLDSSRELPGARKDGTLFPLEVMAREIHVGERRLFIGTLRDLTERRKMEEQLHRAQKMEAIGQLAGGVAHDFNNLLTSIQGSGEMLLRLMLPEDHGRRAVERILQAVERGAALTQRLLAFSRRQMVQPRVVCINQLVTHMRDLLTRMIGEDVKLALELEPRLDSVKIDPVQIDQILMNLATNARHAMPRGGTITIRTGNVELGGRNADFCGVSAGPYVWLSMVDTGIGMDAQTRSRIFEPFFTTKDPGIGTGLGLSTVYGIVKQNEGGVTVESQPDQGACLTIYLPSVGHAGQEPEGREAVEPMPAGHERILLVEDDSLLRDLVCELLEMAGYQILPASGPGEALRLCDAHPIDLVITDMVMPEMDGLTLVGRLRERTEGLRALFMSGYTEAMLADRGSSTAAIPFIRKPFSNAALLAKVRQALDRS